MTGTTVAALFVGHPGVGSYHGIDDVVPYWVSTRKRDQGEWLPIPGIGPCDAREYDGPWPVVAHPPCARWCRLAGMVQSVHGYQKGDDGGCFASALASVRRWGGVLEHQAFSEAWKTFSLAPPPRDGGWVAADDQGGWTCSVEQGRYGHPAKKATWLYAFGTVLPELRWGYVADRHVQATVSWCGKGRDRSRETRRRLRSHEASATPILFRNELLAMARSASGTMDMSREDILARALRNEGRTPEERIAR